MARRATARDVADLAGVSRSAVSLVLNGRGAGNISQEKQKAIRAAAEQLDYTPNAVALSLRSRRTRTLGVLTWPGPVGFSQAMLHRALRKAGEHSYLLLVMDTDEHPIYNKEHERINPDKPILVGDHVWIGCKCALLKGAEIPNGFVL